MICRNCGSVIDDNAKECPFCLFDIDDAERERDRQSRAQMADNALRAEETAARKAGSIRKLAHKAQLIAARKVAAARKAEAKAAKKAEIARKAEAKAARKAEEARRAEAEAARRLEELRRADAGAARKSQLARQAQAAQYPQSPQSPYGARTIPQPQYGVPSVPPQQYAGEPLDEYDQLLRRYPYDGE